MHCMRIWKVFDLNWGNSRLHLYGMSFGLRLAVGERQPVGLQVQCRRVWQQRRALLVVRTGQIQGFQRPGGMQRLSGREVLDHCRRFVILDMPGLSVVIVIASEQLVDISVLVRPWYLRAEWRDVPGLYRGEA